MKQTLNILLFYIAVILLAAVTGCRHDKIEVSASPMASAIPSQDPCLKVFIENSGSMDGYMCDGSQLKDVVYDYISDINRVSTKTELYYINSMLIPYTGNLTNYIKALNPAAFKNAGGNRSNTDLGDLIADVLNEVNDTTVCIFVSDCILDFSSKNLSQI